MKNPFRYGGIVSSDSFCNRIDELTELMRVVRNSGKLFLYGERRVGKSSLLHHLISSLDEDKFTVAFVDVWRCTDTSDFIRECARTFGSTGTQTPESLLQRARKLFTGLAPALTVDDLGKPQLTFSSGHRKIDPPLLSEVLSAPGRIAESSPKKQVLVVFDEFQEIRSFKDDRIERIIRSEVQKHSNVAYIFCGSRRHMIRDMFLKKGNPLYRSAGHYPIGNIALEHWKPFIKERFEMKGIPISDSIIENIFSITDGHPYYTQMICDILWDSCEPAHEPGEEILAEALQTLLEREGTGFSAIWESLPSNPRKMLIAAAFEKPLIQPFSGDIVSRYSLANPSSAKNGLEYLVKHDLIEFSNGTYYISDRFMAHWLHRRFAASHS